MSEAKTTNPHWMGDYPAWDIELPDGTIDKGVSFTEIRIAQQRLADDGSISHYKRYVDVVRQYNIDNYAKWRETNPRMTNH